MENGAFYPLYSKMENNYRCFLEIPRDQYNDITTQLCCKKKLGVMWAVDIDPVLTVGAPAIVGLSTSQGRIVFVAPRRKVICDTLESASDPTRILEYSQNFFRREI